MYRRSIAHVPGRWILTVKLTLGLGLGLRLRLRLSCIAGVIVAVNSRGLERRGGGVGVAVHTFSLPFFSQQALLELAADGCAPRAVECVGALLHPRVTHRLRSFVIAITVTASGSAARLHDHGAHRWTFGLGESHSLEWRTGTHEQLDGRCVTAAAGLHERRVPTAVAQAEVRTRAQEAADHFRVARSCCCMEAAPAGGVEQVHVHAPFQGSLDAGEVALRGRRTPCQPAPAQASESSKRSCSTSAARTRCAYPQMLPVSTSYRAPALAMIVRAGAELSRARVLRPLGASSYCK